MNDNLNNENESRRGAIGSILDSIFDLMRRITSHERRLDDLEEDTRSQWERARKDKETYDDAVNRSRW